MLFSFSVNQKENFQEAYLKTKNTDKLMSSPVLREKVLQGGQNCFAAAEGPSITIRLAISVPLSQGGMHLPGVGTGLYQQCYWESVFVLSPPNLCFLEG